ncbi:MAG TPA: ABC transporter substrate-binding protein [Chloroflexota bacterium]
MTGLNRFVLLLALPALIAGCSPAAPAAAPAGSSQPSAAAPERVLTASISREPDFLGAQAPIPSQSATDFYTRMFNAYLELIDDQSRPMPYLAEALPALHTASWTVFPDGRMETRYHLKPNLVWHDAAPLTADDFVFGFQFATPARGFRTAVVPYTLMADVTAPDDRTVVISWKSAYPDAGVLLGSARFGLVPLPKHLLDDLGSATPDVVQGNPYWAHEYVGLGPYKLDHWELGSYLEAVAFDQHVLGKPKIGRIRLMFMSDTNTAFANILAGTTAMALDSISFAHVVQLKQEWAQSHAGTAGITVASLASLYFQLRPEYVSPKAIMDVNVRKAMAYGMDKETLSDTIWSGELKPMDSIFDPTTSYYPTIERAITKYPYDPRASERLMAEAGYAKGADGFFANPNEGKLELFLRAPPTRPELPVLAANWRKAGFDVTEKPASPQESADPASGSIYPSMSLSASGGSEVQQISIYRAAQVRRAETRWQGDNLGGWSDPAFEKLADGFAVTLDQNERVQQRVEMARMLTEQVPAIPLTYNPNMHAYLNSVRNVGAVQMQTTGRMTWNIYLWELT